MATGLLELLKLKPLTAAKPAQLSGSATPAAAPPEATAAPRVPLVDDERTRANAKRLTVILAKGYDEKIARAQAAVDAQPVAAVKAKLAAAVDAFAAARAEVDHLEPLDGARRMKELDGDAHALAMRAEGLLNQPVGAQAAAMPGAPPKLAALAAESGPGGADGGGGGSGSGGGSAGGGGGSGDAGDGGGKGGGGDRGDGGGKGGSGGGGKLVDEEAIKRIKDWTKEGKISGDTKGLREQLGNKKDKVAQRAAREEVERIRQQVEKGEKVVVPDRAVSQNRGTGGGSRDRGDPHEGRGTDEGISTPGKERLEGLLREEGLSDQEIKDFGEWKEKNNKAGETGEEKDPNSKEKLHDSHDHLDTPEEVKASVKQWREEEGGRSKGPGRQRPSRGKKGGGGDGGDGHMGGGETGGEGHAGGGTKTGGEGHTGGEGGAGGAKPKVAPAVVELEAEAKAYAEKASKLKSASKTIEADNTQLEQRAGELRKQLRAQMNAEKFFADTKTLDADRLKIAERRKALAGEATALKAEAEATVGRMLKKVPVEMEEAFHSKNPKEILGRGYAPKTSVTGAGLLNVFNAVMTGYEIVQGVSYVLDADGVMEGVGRAVEVGAGMAVGVVEGELLAFIAGSTLGGMALAVAITVPSDQGADFKRLEKEAEEKAAVARAKKIAHDEMIAVGRFLEKTAPGSVEWTENVYIVHNKELWDRTVAQVHEMQANYLATQYATVLKRAYDLGVSSGHLSGEFTRVDEIKGWKEVKESPNPLVFSMELFEEYKRGFKVGNVKLKALQERASKLGYADAKAGKPRASRQVNAWPEIAQVITDGANPVVLLTDLAEWYEEAYDAKANKK